MIRYIGIDVSKDTLDAAYENEKAHHKVFSNSEIGFQQLLNWSRERGCKLVFCMEATGAYSSDIAEFLHSRGIQVHIQNARLIKSFRESENERNSTDKTNSFSIARYAAAHIDKMKVWKPLPAHIQKLRDLVRMREVLIDTKVEWTNRRKSRSCGAAAAYADKMLAQICAEIKAIEKEMRLYVKATPDLASDVLLLRSIKGIGFVTACLILGEMPWIREFDNKSDAVAFAGLNPALRKSGTSINFKPMLSKKGSSRLRKGLYMPAIVATHRNARIKEMAAGLKERGKHPCSIIGAAMRRLVCYAYGVLKSGEPMWTEHRQSIQVAVA